MRVTCAGVGVMGCVFAIHGSLKVGRSRSQSELAQVMGSVPEATMAVLTSPYDPETYKSRAVLLARDEEFGLAAEDLRTAIRLRPNDYGLWSRLGHILEAEGDPASALAAFTEAQRLAPAYGNTNWDLGLALMKLRRRDEGFAQLRRASLSKPQLMPEVMEIAWDEYAGDIGAIEKAIGPRSSAERLELALFLIKYAAPDKALAFASHVESLTANDRRQLIRSLVEAKRFTEAFAIWKALDAESDVPTGRITDGSFESGRLAQESPFDWDLSRPDSAIRISVEPTGLEQKGRGQGGYSLRMDWNGNPKSAEPICQLILVAPNTHYELSFVARPQNLITGGSPFVQVTDVSQDDQLLARSQDLPLGTRDWEKQSVQFTTGPTARAVRIGIRRESCAQEPCPIFGTLNLDDFSLQRFETPLRGTRQSSAMRENRPLPNSCWTRDLPRGLRLPSEFQNENYIVSDLPAPNTTSQP